MLKFLEFIKNNYISYSYSYSLFPNQDGKFCLIYKINEDVNIPNYFKECLKNYFDVNIKEQLLDNRFTTLKFNLHKKHIYDYKDVLRENFKNEKKYISSYIKKEAALCLLKIIPKKNEKEEEKVDNQEKQR